MLMQGDFDLNSVQIYTESLREGLKNTMLNQEVIFRKQVEELHRVYTIQRTLTENLSWKEFDRYSSRKASTQSTLLPCANRDRFEPFAKETTFSSIPTVGSTQSTSHLSLEGNHTYSKLWQRPLDLQLPADQYVSHVDPELKLSLSTGEDNWRNRSAKRIWFSKNAHSSPHNIIDLEEESIERISNEDEKHAPSFKFAAPVNNFGGKHEPEVSVLSDLVISSSVKKDLPEWIAGSRSLLDDNKCCHNSFKAPPGLRGDLGRHSSDPENENFGFMSELPNDLLHDSNRMCLANRQINFEKSEVEDGCGNLSPGSCKSHCNVDNDSSSIKTMQSGIEKRSSNISTFDQFSGTRVVCQVPETLSSDQDQGSSDSSESKHGCFNKKEESSEQDALINMAAESLIHFSLESSSRNQVFCTKAGLDEMKSEERAQPQRSSDSFELITLNLKECSADDYCVSSKPFEVNDVETKDFAYKLRRGRRLKDFQKDILPGLSSLSRHEIREDINILEGVLRSREYRKIRASMGDGQSWCAPVRSRRSRINYVGRKKRF
uniref:Uncharacterized protein n=1 Tax=Fagus sylvatica TaxID=28930 RepID=A0A2N9G7J6_FAGSY